MKPTHRTRLERPGGPATSASFAAALALAALLPALSPGPLPAERAESAAPGAEPLDRQHDWPQWRGEGRDGVWRETGLRERFDAPSLPPLWSAPVGGGYSGPTVAEGRVYLSPLPHAMRS